MNSLTNERYCNCSNFPLINQALRFIDWGSYSLFSIGRSAWGMVIFAGFDIFSSAVFALGKSEKLGRKGGSVAFSMRHM